MSRYQSSSVEWSPWTWDEEHGQYYRHFVDANEETHIQWQWEVAQDASTPRETDYVPDVSALTLQEDPSSPGDDNPSNYVAESSSRSKPRSKSHKSSKSKSSKSKSKSHRKSKSRATEDGEEDEEQEPVPAGATYFDHGTGQYLPYPGTEQDPEGQYGAGDDDETLRAYHESIKYSRDQYSAGGPSTSTYAPYEPNEAEDTPPRRAEEHIAGTGGAYEKLDPRFQVVHSNYFQPGEVFKVLWPEPAGSTKGAPSVTAYPDPYGGHIFAHFRRFIVIANDYGHCQCVPISTYGKKGCTKSGAKPSQHGIVYEMDSSPMLLHGEPELGFDPIRLQMTDPSERISEESRVNYSKLTTVEHNVKVFFIGRVVPEDFQIAKHAVDTCWLNKIHHTHHKRHRRQ